MDVGVDVVFVDVVFVDLSVDVVFVDLSVDVVFVDLSVDVVFLKYCMMLERTRGFLLCVSYKSSKAR